MKTLVNIHNPAIRITTPEIIEEDTYYTLDGENVYLKSNWALVENGELSIEGLPWSEEEPEGWIKADCVKEIPFSLIYEEFAEHWRLGKAVEPGDYYIPISRLRWGIKENLEEIPSNVDLEKALNSLDNAYFDLDGIAVMGATYYLTVNDLKDIARDFYELGLNARKGELEHQEVNLEEFTEKMDAWKARFNHPDDIPIKATMAFTARMFYMYPDVARQWYEQLPKTTMDFNTRKEE